MPRRRPSRRAFTLVELIATMTILAALGSVVSVVIASSTDGYTRASTTAQLHSELSVALDRIDQMLRYIPNIGGSPDITSLSGTSITWETDWSLNLNGAQLLLVKNGGTASVLLDDVSALSIQAYDESNAPLGASLSGTACGAIRRIAINITLTRNGVTEALRTRVFLRAMATGMGG